MSGMDGYLEAGAILSPCETYRYLLTREWLLGEKTCLFVMLNPSKADGAKDDHTIRKCVGFAQRWGYKRLEVANLFAYRSTEPKNLLPLHKDVRVGPANENYLREAAGKAARVVCAWGGEKALVAERSLVVLALLRRTVAEGTPLCAIGLTKDGFPMHPRTLAYNMAPVAL